MRKNVSQRSQRKRNEKIRSELSGSWRALREKDVSQRSQRRPNERKGKIMSTEQLLQESEQERKALLSKLEDLKQVKEKLQKSYEYNRLLFNSSPIGLALCRMDGSLVDVNPAYAKILSRTIDETLKLSYWDITPKKYADQETLQLKSLDEIATFIK